MCTVPNQFALPLTKKQKEINSHHTRESSPVYCTKSIRTTNAIQNFEFMLCSIKYFTTCIMHGTCYSNERFSSFETYILPLEYELNLNLFLYLSKIYNYDCCEVKPFELVSLF